MPDPRVPPESLSGRAYFVPVTVTLTVSLKQGHISFPLEVNGPRHGRERERRWRTEEEKVLVDAVEEGDGDGNKESLINPVENFSSPTCSILLPVLKRQYYTVSTWYLQ